MRYPQLLIYERDGRLAEAFRHWREQDRQRKFALREPRSLESCLRLLGRAGPTALVLKVGQDVVRELTLLERVTWSYPDVFAVVVGDTQNPALAELAWDLGAAMVLFPPLPREWMFAIVDAIMTAGAAGPTAPLRPQRESDLSPLPESAEDGDRA